MKDAAGAGGGTVGRRQDAVNTLSVLLRPHQKPQFWRKFRMTVLVTGGAGYIGSHMVWQLVDSGEDVVVLTAALVPTGG